MGNAQLEVPGESSLEGASSPRFPIKRKLSGMKVSSSVVSVGSEEQSPDGRHLNILRRGLSHKVRKKGMYGQSIINAVGRGIRYGLLVDQTKGKRKQGTLTLFWSGPLPDDSHQKSARHSRRGKAPPQRREASEQSQDANVHLFDVVKLIHHYNAFCRDPPMRMFDDRVHFTGYVEIHLNLVHPISIHRPISPPQLQQRRVMERAEEAVIYLNDMTTKMLIDSTTMTKDIIEGLVKKYDVADDISNFALYDCDSDRGGPGGRELDSDEKPLLLCLVWGPVPKHSLSLQLASCGRKRLGTFIHWDSFSLIELQNFLRMLEIEERKHIENIEKIYECKRKRLEKLMDLAEKEEAEGIPTPDGSSL